MEIENITTAFDNKTICLGDNYLIGTDKRKKLRSYSRLGYLSNLDFSITRIKTTDGLKPYGVLSCPGKVDVSALVGQVVLDLGEDNYGRKMVQCRVIQSKA